MKPYVVLKALHGVGEDILVSEHDTEEEAMASMMRAFCDEKLRVASLDKVRQLYKIWFSSWVEPDLDDLKKLRSDMDECWYSIYLMNAPILGYDVYPKGSRESIGACNEHGYSIDRSENYLRMKKRYGR